MDDITKITDGLHVDRDNQKVLLIKYIKGKTEILELTLDEFEKLIRIFK